MRSSPKVSIKTKEVLGFIDARLSQARLASERATSAPPLPSKGAKPIELRAETESRFTIGLDLPDKPTTIAISINYNVLLKDPSTDKNLIEYEAIHEAQFAIIKWTGFKDWTNMPPGAIAPYLTVLHNIALRKAERTLLEMGVKSLSLPVPTGFEGDLTLSS